VVILGPFAFSVFVFCHPFGGRDSLLKKERFTKSADIGLFSTYEVPIISTLFKIIGLFSKSPAKETIMCKRDV
jgi:hypothetical protein